jgi:hypothetical protein
MMIVGLLWSCKCSHLFSADGTDNVFMSGDNDHSGRAQFRWLETTMAILEFTENLLWDINTGRLCQRVQHTL